MILKLNIKEFVGLKKSDNTPVFETKNFPNINAQLFLEEDVIEFSFSDGEKHNADIEGQIINLPSNKYGKYRIATNENESVYVESISVLNGVAKIHIPNLKIDNYVNLKISISSDFYTSNVFSFPTKIIESIPVYGYDSEINYVVKNIIQDLSIDLDEINIDPVYNIWSILEVPFENKINIFHLSSFDAISKYRINNILNDIQLSSNEIKNFAISKDTNLALYSNANEYKSFDFKVKEYYPTISSVVNSYETDIKYIQNQDIIVSTEIDYSNVATYTQDEIEVFPNQYGKLTVRNKESNDEVAIIVKSDVNNKVTSVTSVLPAYGDIHDIIEINTKFDSFCEYQFVESSEIKKGFYKLFNYVDYNVLEDNITKGFRLTLYNKYVYIEFYGNETIDLQDKGIKLIELDSVNVYNPCCLNDDQVYMIENKGSNQDVDNGDMFLGSFPVQGGNSFLASKVFETNSIIFSFYAEGDLPYRIEQKSCNEIDFTNNSNQYDLLVSVYRMLEDSSSFDEEADIEEIIEKETKTLSLFEGTNIYKIEIRFKSRDEILSEKDDIVVHYFVLKCDFTECLLKYTNELICCDTTNCDSSIDCRCVEKQYYNFNAFMTLAHTVVAMMNDIYIDSEMFRFLLTQEEINEKVKKLYDLRTILNRAKEYCLDCETIKSNSTPCKGC